MWNCLIFSWANTHPFELQFFAYCPKFSGYSYVEFQEKCISGEFFGNSVETKAILYQNLWNFAYFRQFLFWVRVALEKFSQVLTYVVCTQVRRHVHKRITKRRYGEENTGRFVFGKPVLFTLGLRLSTPYSFGVLVWNFYQTFVTVSIEFWLRFEAQIRSSRLAINFLLITVRAERKVGLCVKLFDLFRGRILIRLNCNLSRIVPNSVEILTWNFRKKVFRENFLEILCKPRLSSTNTCEISPYFRQFLFWVRVALKKFTQVLPYVVCTHVRRHVHKRITKRRYGEENPRRFVFGKPVLFTLGLRLSTPYSFGVLVWNFYQTFFAVSIKFWMRFEAQIRSTRLAINFLLITATAERKVRLCVKLFDFFRGRILIRLTWNLSRFVSNSVEIFTWNFRKKTISEEFFGNFVQTKAILYQNLWNFALFSAIFILGPYCAGKVHTSTSICCLHPGKEARP